MDQGFGILQAVLPWERQPGEGPKPWQAFQMYLTMGRDRSAMAVAEQLGKSEGLVARWCRTHRWVDRVAAWDAEQHRKTLIELDEARREMIERHTRVGRVILSKVAQRLIGDEVAGVSALAPSALTPSDIARLFEVAVKIERQSRGVPDSVQQIEHAGLVTSAAVDPEFAREVLANPAARQAAFALSAALYGEEGGFDEDGDDNDDGDHALDDRQPG